MKQTIFAKMGGGTAAAVSTALGGVWTKPKLQRGKAAWMLLFCAVFAAALIACNGKAQAQSPSGGGDAGADLKKAADAAKQAVKDVKEAAGALQTFQQILQGGANTANVADIIKAAQSLSAADLAELTQKNGSPSGDFKYDLSADGKGIVIREYTGGGGIVVIPETIEDYPVTEIGEIAFQAKGWAVKAVVLSAAITKIGNRAFTESRELASINFPAGLKEIGSDAFYGTGLTSVTLPEGLVSLGDVQDRGTFAICESLTSLTLPGSLKTIPGMTFMYSKITELVIPEGVETIGDRAFASCGSLLSVTLPSSIKKIEAMAFSGCSGLTDIVIPDSVTSIAFSGGEMGAFGGCGKLKLAVRQRLKDLGYQSAF